MRGALANSIEAGRESLAGGNVRGDTACEERLALSADHRIDRPLASTQDRHQLKGRVVMTRRFNSGRTDGGAISRRALVGAMAAGAAITGSRGAMAQAQKAAPQTVITTPPRDFGSHGAPSTYFWDPDVVIVDPVFRQYVQPNTPIMCCGRVRCGQKARHGMLRAASCVEQHPEQSPAALDRRQWRGQRLPHAFELQ